MKLALLALIALSIGVAALTHPLDGQWFGSIDTDRGTMQIGLTLHETDGKLRGTVNTPHGDWPITSVTEESGSYTVAFTSGDGDGKLVGRVQGDRFAGTWDYHPHATGTFELTKRK